MDTPMLNVNDNFNISQNVKNRCLFEVLKNDGFVLQSSSSESRNALISYLKHRLGENWSTEEEFENCVKGKIEGFCCTLNKKWKESNRCLTKFLLKNENWLDLDFKIPALKNNSIINQPSTSSGRPRKLFLDSSDRSKRRQIKNLRDSTSSNELIHTTKSKLYLEGKRAAADLISQVTEYSPQRAIKIRLLYKNKTKSNVSSYTEDEALALMVDARMTKESYHKIRLGAKKHGANIYPSYDRIRLAKQRCYPENIVVNETSASVSLQNLLDHTIKRLCETLDFDGSINYAEEYTRFQFVCKWGCDGSSGHNEYHQHFGDKGLDEDRQNIVTDSSIFLFSIVPLRLTASTKVSNDKVILWENPSPSSTRYCRPLKFLYEKETLEITKHEVRKVEKEIMELKSVELNVNNSVLSVNYIMLMTMVDGKVINTLTESSSQICYICKCNPKNMNDLENMHNFQVNEDNFKYGLSSLHAWIKFLELVLHIAYKLETAPTSKRATVEQKNKIESKKKEIQFRIWNEIGIKVDRVVQGKGTSNTGNVARRFFKNTEKVAEITGINLNLLNRFSVILSVISCGYEINYDEFEIYTKETAELYVQLYNWYRMPPSIHKILIHGSLIIKNALVPIGNLSEEAQEASNKNYIRIREHNSRKSSRTNTNTDLLNFLLVSSDPIITSLRSQPKISHTKLPPEVIQLLNIEGSEVKESDTSGSEISYSDSE